MASAILTAGLGRQSIWRGLTNLQFVFAVLKILNNGNEKILKIKLHCVPMLFSHLFLNKEICESAVNLSNKKHFEQHCKTFYFQ